VVLDITTPLSHRNILDALPDLSEARATPGAKTAKSPVRITADRQQSTHLDGAAGTKTRSALLDPRTAPLDQNNQDDDRQHAGNNLNSRTAHVDSSFLND
jgi:hypothetical protein